MEKKNEVEKVDLIKNHPDLAKIWDELSSAKFKIFGLSNQSVTKFCSPIFVEPTKLYLKYNHTSVLPYLEENFPNLTFALENKYITVARKDATE